MVGIQAVAYVKVAEPTARWAKMNIEWQEVILSHYFPSNRSEHNIDSVLGQYLATKIARMQHRT
jgi:hypothetical protein